MTSAPTVSAPAELAAVVQREMERWHVPGLTLGVLRDGQVETWGFGIASIETEQPVRTDTLFQIGSITKVFTTTLIMRLVDDGKISLDQPVSSFLPGFSLGDAEASATVSLRQMLSHQAGFFGDNFKDFGPGDDALSKAIAAFPELRQLTRPGELWAYCNTAFQVAGAIIEHNYGTTYEQAMHEHLLEPLGLERSFFFADEAITHPAAVGHNKLPGKEIEIARPYQLPRAMHAAGAIIATVADLLTFARFHMGDGAWNGQRLLSEASVRAMQQPQIAACGFADHYGVGWAIQQIDGETVIGHGGSTNGFRARLSIVPSRGFAVAMLANGSGGRAAEHFIGDWVIERYAGLRRTDPPVVSVPDADLEPVAGRYVQPLAEITVTRTGSELSLSTVAVNPFRGTRVAMPPERAVPIGSGRFLILEGENTGETFDFIPAEGTPRFIRFHGRLADREE